MQDKTKEFAVYAPGVTVPGGVYILQPYGEKSEAINGDKGKKETKSVIRKIFRWASLGIITLFAIIGLLFSGVFVAMQFGIFNVKGSSVSRDQFFATLPKADIKASSISRTAPDTSCVRQVEDGSQIPICSWNTSEEYATIRDGLSKDRDVINKVSKQTGVSSRMIAAVVVPEQLRWFTSDREYFKKMFEPLKILGTASNMTYGIGGFHHDTAKRVEQYTEDINSPFYAGDGMAALLAFPGVDKLADGDTLARLSDSKDHYYSYLYVALFIKEITNQWEKAGYNIANRPDVIATLYNIGFDKSVPKSNPQIGGAEITVNTTKYTYGELGTVFYSSDELTAIYPVAY